jgi:two-component system response regulator AtoC
MARPHPPSAHHPTDRLLGDSPVTRDLRAHIRQLATFDTLGNPHVPTVLIHGETGTGKGLIAQIVHASGPRAAGPFIEINCACAAIPESLLVVDHRVDVRLIAATQVDL